MTTFVYDGVEVKKTGRTATRDVATTSQKTRTLVLVEIMPIDSSFDWKKWVDPKQLYSVDNGGKSDN